MTDFIISTKQNADEPNTLEIPIGAFITMVTDTSNHYKYAYIEDEHLVEKYGWDSETEDYTVLVETFDFNRWLMEENGIERTPNQEG